MTKRIFRSIFLVALVVLLLSVALLSVVFYNDYAVQYRSELKSEALSMAHAINGGLAEEDYLRSLEQDKISPIRITWIGADGTVRYDNEAAPAQMENHAARTEVADALRYGAGESERYSATLSQKTFYYACRLQDGTVLRLAGTRDSVLGIRPELSIRRFRGDLPSRYEPAPGPCKLEACLFTIDDATGRCTAVRRVDIHG